MAGLALALDLLRTTTTAAASKSLHSSSSLSALSAAVTASVGVTFLPSYPAYPLQFQARDWTGQCAVCEAEDTLGSLAEPDSRWVPQWELKPVPGTVKAYNVELKPLFSAFRPRALGATTVRACLVNFLPLLEAYIQPQEDDTEEDAERPANLPEDPVIPLKRSGAHIVREVAVITTRRILERVVIYYGSPRTAWKLLKDVPKSAVRKAGRETSKWTLFVGVTKTTFRGHALGVMSNWVVQLILDIYTYLRTPSSNKKADGKKKVYYDPAQDFHRLLRKTAGNTLKGGASLILAAVGAGIGTLVIKPSIGTWIGCAAGDLSGPYLIGIWLDTWILYGTFDPST